LGSGYNGKRNLVPEDPEEIIRNLDADNAGFYDKKCRNARMIDSAKHPKS
jgi:hypothetical protein